MKKILFICSKNKLRSPTAEAVFSSEPEWEVRSAGLSRDAEIRLSYEDVQWAHIIFVMEKVHRAKLLRDFKKFLKNQNVICLDIPDDFEYMQPELVEILRNTVPRYINRVIK